MDPQPRCVKMNRVSHVTPHSRSLFLLVIMTNNSNITITTQSPPLPNNLADDEIDSIIHYQPASELISYNWQTAQDVLNYLILHPEDRYSLLQEAQKRSPQWPKLFFVIHPLLPHILQVNSFEKDHLFLASLHFLQRTLEPSPMLLKYLTPPFAPHTSFSTPPEPSEVLPSPASKQNISFPKKSSYISVFRLPSKPKEQLPPLFTYQPLSRK